jgi:hypothetical protein
MTGWAGNIDRDDWFTITRPTDGSPSLTHARSHNMRFLLMGLLLKFSSKDPQKHQLGIGSLPHNTLFSHAKV